MEQKVVEIINGITAGQYSEEQIRIADFEENKILDSLQIVELVMALEEAFEIEIEDEDLSIDNLKSMETILSLIKRLSDGEED